MQTLAMPHRVPDRSAENNHDTRPDEAGVCILSAQDGCMSAIRGLAHRPQNVPTVLLQGRVSPETRMEVRAAAAASGVSIAYYMEALVAQIVADQGCLPLVEHPRDKKLEELPIPAA